MEIGGMDKMDEKSSQKWKFMNTGRSKGATQRGALPPNGNAPLS